jgi:hypothetical protein
MNKITLQQIFDAAFQAFIIEDRPPCVGSSGACFYRGPNNTHCAVGLVLPPEIDNPEGTFTSVMGQYSEFFHEDLFKMTQEELDNFQQALHDDLCLHNKIGKVQPEWALNARQRLTVYIIVAKAYNLKVPSHRILEGHILPK